MTIFSEAKKQADAIKKVAKHADKLDLSASLNRSGKNASARIYELFVNLLALNDLSKYWNLELVNFTHLKHIIFPGGPAHKSRYPYFKVYDLSLNRCVFQICLGTEYSNDSGTTFAPDLSFQCPDSPSSPKEKDVVICWDCKYTATGRLNRDEIAKVAGHLIVIQALGKLSLLPFKSKWPNENAVITNAVASTYDDDDFKKLNICEISECTDASTPFSVRP